MIDWLILGLALTGLVISLYFTFAYYGHIKKSRWIPEILCAREGSGWITEENLPRDIVLQPGGCYRLRQPGLAVVHALGGEATVTLS